MSTPLVSKGVGSSCRDAAPIPLTGATAITFNTPGQEVAGVDERQEFKDGMCEPRIDCSAMPPGSPPSASSLKARKGEASFARAVRKMTLLRQALRSRFIYSTQNHD